MKKILVLLMSLILFVGCNKKVEENNIPKEDENKNPVILEDQVVNDLDIKDFNITTTTDNITYIYFDIINNTENVIGINKVTYKLFENDREVLSVTKKVAGPIEPGELRSVVSQADLTLSNVNKVEYVIE